MAHERQPSELDKLPWVRPDKDAFLHKYVWGKEENEQREALKFVDDKLSEIPPDVIDSIQELGKKRKKDANVPTENSSEWSDPEKDKYRKDAYKWLEIKKNIDDIIKGKDEESKRARTKTLGGKPKNKKTKNNKKNKRRQTKKKAKRRNTIKRSSKKCRQTKKNFRR